MVGNALAAKLTNVRWHGNRLDAIGVVRQAHAERTGFAAFAQQIVAVALENLVFAYADFNIQITGLRTGRNPSPSFAATAAPKMKPRASIPAMDWAPNWL